ncbi:MAG: hypothetical protein WBA01_01195, partial [Phormidesmis sp.]
MQTILVIEAPSPSRNALVDHLTSADFLVNTADDGAAGVRAGRQHRPDVIICSWELDKKWTGHRVLKAVRKDSE